MKVLLCGIDNCQSKFATPQNKRCRDNHWKDVHGIGNSNTYACPYFNQCKHKPFKTPASWTKHLVKKHEHVTKKYNTKKKGAENTASGIDGV